MPDTTDMNEIEQLEAMTPFERLAAWVDGLMPAPLQDPYRMSGLHFQDQGEVIGALSVAHDILGRCRDRLKHTDNIRTCEGCEMLQEIDAILPRESDNTTADKAPE